MTVRPASVLKRAALAGLLLLGVSFTPNAAARTRCSHSGPPRNLLTVTVDMRASGQIIRRGEEIVARAGAPPPQWAHAGSRPLPERASRCRGGVPTVRNTDTITVLLRGEEDSVEVLLGGGPFAPGATPETEGASEIEIEVRGRGPFAEVRGTRSADEFHWGPGRANHPGLNLNPRDTGDQDVDVTVRGGRFASLLAWSAAGNDTIAPAPGAPSPNYGVYTHGGRGDDRLTAPPNSRGILVGEAGDDVLIGGRQADTLVGGDGNDRLTGAGGADLIAAGRGRDLIFGGPGRDRINPGGDAPSVLPRDSHRDMLRCGAGRDRVRADRRDRLRGCEVVRHG
jgi:RTX calcium-binding nonapeptide repeat (4 copies)